MWAVITLSLIVGTAVITCLGLYIEQCLRGRKAKIVKVEKRDLLIGSRGLSMFESTGINQNARDSS